MTAKVHIGSISSGTLRTEDLLDAFASELERLAGDDDRYTKLISDANDVDAESEEAEDIVNELQDALSDFAPAHTYFGSLEGDGADYGFWPLLDFDGCETHEISRGRNGEGEMLDLTCGLYVTISDHGNVTVSTIEPGEEIWSAV